MEQRQSGAIASALVDDAERSGKAVKDKTAMILRAYEVPVGTSSKTRAQVVKDFENQIYVECMKRMLP